MEESDLATAFMLLCCGWSRWSQPWRWRCQIGWDVCHQKLGRFLPLTDVGSVSYASDAEGLNWCRGRKWLDFPSSLYLSCRASQGRNTERRTLQPWMHPRCQKAPSPSDCYPTTLDHLQCHTCPVPTSLCHTQLSEMQRVRTLLCSHLQDQNYIHIRIFHQMLWGKGGELEKQHISRVLLCTWMCETIVNKFFWSGIRIKGIQSSRYLWYHVPLKQSL